jgi:antitoxin HigA-1
MIWIARAVDHSYRHILHVVNGQADIEAKLAWKLAAIFGTTPEFWLNLQNAVDLWEAHQSLVDWRPEVTYPAQREVHI